MGSLTKAPKPRTQIVTVPAAPANPTPVTAPSTPEPSRSEQSAEQRESNLLLRERGRFGTIATGFRGFLSQNETREKRKTLLGE